MGTADWAMPGENGLPTLGERVRSLRRSAGLSQAELAAGRFSKEYVSQIERGKTRPTQETLEWLADRLRTDAGFLEHGVTRADAARIDQQLAEAERLLDVGRYGEALDAFAMLRELAGPTGTRASFRLHCGEAWARVRTGDLDGATTLLEEAASLALGTGFSDVDRAQVVFEVGVVRYSESKIGEALTLFDQALVLAEGAGGPSDRLRSDIFHWRSRCNRRNRDWAAAEDDIERALELADASGDTRRLADALFQSSLVAQREGRWVLARAQAERSRELFDELGDRATVARLLNNLAGLNHLLGDSDRAISLLDEAFALFVDLDLGLEAGYVCSSLAAIQLDQDDRIGAADSARKALALLDGRVDHLQEVGMAQLTLGRALAGLGELEQAESWITAAETSFGAAASPGHRSYAWMARGDLEARRGSDAAAARLYRQAAVTLGSDAWLDS
jgi:transcriptional regulator with XRE-family HTH domain